MSESLTWASALITSLYEHGVRHTVISPGSRSTPLTLAAAIHPGIEKKVILDERSAAFVALGIGKYTGVPAVLICTSGTAVANYYPAVTEAKESGVPMIILSADRPPNLRNLGSSQTVDQLKIFGDQAVFFHEAGEPAVHEQDLKRIAYVAKQAVEFSIDKGGAAHINLPFRKPLEPDAGDLNREKEKLTDLSPSKEHYRTRNTSTVTLDEEISSLISSAERPLLIAGPSNINQALTKQILRLTDHLQAPVLAEPGSQVDSGSKSIRRFDQFLRSTDAQKQLRPDLVIRFGDQPYSKSLLEAFDGWKNIPVLQITARTATQDHLMAISHKIICKQYDSFDLDAIKPKTEKSWFDLWVNYEREAEKILRKELKNIRELTDGHVFHYFSKQISNDWNVMLSNSFPARDMLTFGSSQKNQFANRGAAGIDGILSTSLGIYFSSDHPSCCFIGDLAFLHDSNALFTLQQVRDRPFVVIVLNNKGGNIFRMLPVYSSKKMAVPAELYQNYFETPQDIKLEFLAKASSVAYQKVKSLSGLNKIDVNEVKGALIIECHTHPDQSMELRKRLWNS